MHALVESFLRIHTNFGLPTFPNALSLTETDDSFEKKSINTEEILDENLCKYFKAPEWRLDLANSKSI